MTFTLQGFHHLLASVSEEYVSGLTARAETTKGNVMFVGHFDRDPSKTTLQRAIDALEVFNLKSAEHWNGHPANTLVCSERDALALGEAGAGGLAIRSAGYVGEGVLYVGWEDPATQPPNDPF